jgi:FMN reductase
LTGVAAHGLSVLLIDGSPRSPGRTSATLAAVAAGVNEAGAECHALRLSGDLAGATAEVLERAARCDAFVLASPTYRATYTAELKYLLDRTPRGMPGETGAPLRARAVAVVLTGATLHHFLALDSLRSVLAGFFGAYVLPGGLYVPHAGFEPDGGLAPEWREPAARQGRALVALAAAINASPELQALAPQV